MDSGAARVQNAEWIAKNDFKYIEHYDINWVAPYSDGATNGIKNMVTECSEISGSTTQKATCVLEALGMPSEGTTDFNNPSYSDSNRMVMLKIYGDALDALNLRMASGNEDGVNDEWVPGGYTSSDGGKTDGVREALIDTIHIGQYCWTPISTKDGEFCYPNCAIECGNDLTECYNTACTSEWEYAHSESGNMDIGQLGKTMSDLVDDDLWSGYSLVITKQDLVIICLVIINLVLLIGLITVCATRRGGRVRKVKYAPPMFGDSEMEELQR